ncbi:helix-turn-helix domain-containing protein [Actinomadura rubrisoli]|uniref:XRE family transcriptional regulator n=1 Tax=Actinomadura rubrisoli TaxID=2530368 RepID=A0A4R5CJR5_9ACTN|nr:helix-turn-helix transcriptional regulator [Actinomadura rubrisoli]TDD97662.1 XRE family transcriptional regulator [Actinomadura rubrisoli]
MIEPTDLTAARWSPAVRRQRLAGVLADLRDRDGRTAEQIASELGVAKTTVIRLENPRHLTLPKRELIERLLDVYRAGTATRKRVRDLVDEARQRDWWHPYKPYLRPAHTTYLGLEAETAVQRIYQPTLLPGLLQTAAYSAITVKEQHPALPEREAEAFTAERRARHERMLTGPDPIRLWAVLGEAALLQAVGGPRVMAEQLDYLHRMAQLPHVTITIVPFSAGAHEGLAPFVILTFPQPTDPELAYIPDPVGHWVRTREDVDHLVGVFERLMLLLPDRDANLQMIAAAAQRFRAET